jgi:hypothetical protein
MMRHVKVSQLFLMAEGSIELGQDEQHHLKQCEDCQEVLQVFQTYTVADSSGTDDYKQRMVSH